MVRTQRRSPLHTNLTKWLSKCEGSLLEAKEKYKYMVIDDEGQKLNEHGRKHKIMMETELTMDEKIRT